MVLCQVTRQPSLISTVISMSLCIMLLQRELPSVRSRTLSIISSHCKRGCDHAPGDGGSDVSFLIAERGPFCHHLSWSRVVLCTIPHRLRLFMRLPLYWHPELPRSRSNFALREVHRWGDAGCDKGCSIGNTASRDPDKRSFIWTGISLKATGSS
jgi:hypothetical protein